MFSRKPIWQYRSSGTRFSMVLLTGIMILLVVAPTQALVVAPQLEAGILGVLVDEPEMDTDGGVIFISETALGSIDHESDADMYTFQGLAGEAVRIEVHNTAGELDPAVTLFFDTTRLFGGTTATVLEKELSQASSVVANPLSPDLPQAEVSVEILSPLYGTNILIPASPTNIQVSGKAGVTGTGSTTALEVAIVIDISGSIDDVGYQLEADGVREILKALDPDGDGTLSAPVALIQFDDIGSITAPLTRSRAQVESGLSRLRSDGGTHYDNAFQTALQALAPSSTSDTVTELTLFFSDGDPNYGTYTPPGSGGPLDQYPADGIRIDTFGIGSYVDPNILTTIAQSTGGTYTAIPTFNDIPKVTASLPGIAGLQSVVLDIDGDGIGDVTANVGVDGSFTAVVPIYVGRNTITAIATATDTNLAPATDTIVVFGFLGVQVGNNVGIIHDDDSGAGTNALIEVAQLPFSGTYSLLVTASANATSGDYELALKPIDYDSNMASISLGTNYSNLINTRSGKIVYSSGAGVSFSGFSPDGRTAATSLDAGYVDLINTETGAKVYPSGAGSSFSGFSPDGGTAAISLDAGYVDLINTETGAKVYASGAGSSFSGFSPDGGTAVISLDAGYVDLINTETGAKVYASGAGSSFTGFSPDGGTAAISLDAGYVDLINTETGAKVYASGAGSSFTGFSPDGGTAAISLDAGYVDLINTETGAKVYASGAGSSFSGFSPDGGTAAISLGTGYVDLINTETGAKVYASGAGSSFTGFSPDGDTAVISLGADYANLVNTRGGGIVYSSGAGSSFTGFSFDRTRNVVTHAAHNLYAPMVTRIVAAPPVSGVSGLISYQGSGIGDIDLELRFYDGSIWSTMASTKTGSDGQYLFSNVPSLGSGQEYYVRYGPNESDYRYLYDWYGPFITAYTTGGSASGGNFDIANFSLLSPDDFSNVSFPVTFNWEGRGLNNDTFRWRMFDYYGDYEWDSGDPAGAVSYTLSDLPSDAVYGEEYYWDVFVHNGPDSYGTCIDYYAVTFSSSLMENFLPGVEKWLVDRMIVARPMRR